MEMRDVFDPTPEQQKIVLTSAVTLHTAVKSIELVKAAI
jgi:hypothetical protein